MRDVGNQVQICPCIYQEVVDKIFDLRVTAIGDAIYCAQIEESCKSRDFVDWRPYYGTSKLMVSSFHLNESVCQKIRILLNLLDLSYGCIDFAVDKNGELYFLEINPGGQFLFMRDDVAEFNLLYSFSTMLMQGEKDWITEDDYTRSINMSNFEKSDLFKIWENKSEERQRDERFIAFID